MAGLLWLMPTLLQGAIPVVGLPEGEKPVRIMEVAVNAVPPLPVLDEHQPKRNPISRVAGRNYIKLDAVKLKKIQLPAPETEAVGKAAEAHGFDLWAMADEIRAANGDALLLTFSIQASEARMAFLGLGCSDQVAVFCNSEPVHAGSGGRELFFNQDIIPLKLKAGLNLIEVVCQNASRWIRIPQGHFDPEWSVGLELFSSPESAWRAHRGSVYHPLDFPILPGFDEVRIEASVPGHEKVAVFDLAGRAVMSGVVVDGGRVVWEANGEKPRRPFFGTLVVGDDFGEPIMIGQRDEVVNFCAKMSEATGSGQSAPAWKYRLEHLLKPSNRNFSDAWWQRKLLIALYRVSVNRPVDEFEKCLRVCPSLRVEFGEYQSAIDGTRQFYRIFRCRERQGRTPPVLVIVPFVPQPFRPFLESASLANQKEQEQLASVADEWGVDLVWPGLVDVDYGGPLMSAGLQECINQVKGDSSAGIYLMGMCSAGVGAIVYAKEKSIDGLILQSPVVNRKHTKWLPGLNSFETHYPPSVDEREQTERPLELLVRTPIRLSYDIDIPGHGDREGSAAFIKTMMGLGGQVDADWRPIPLKFFPWGERLKTNVATWLQWVNAIETGRQAQPKPGPSPVLAQPLLPTQPTTVKAAMLQGFAVVPTNDPVFSRWLKDWFRVYKVYRGAEPAWAASQQQNASPVTITFCQLKPEEQTAASLGKILLGAPQISTNSLAQSGINPSTKLFGFCLLETEAGARIEMFRSGVDDMILPPLDLMLDGGCRGALWRQAAGSWVLVDAWL